MYISARSRNQNRFGPANKKQVKFDLDAKTRSISIPHTEAKFISTPSLKSSPFVSPLDYQVDFDPPTQKPSYFR